MRVLRNRAAALFFLLAFTAPASAGLSLNSAALVRMAAGDRRAVTEIADSRATAGNVLESVAPFRLEAGGLQRSLAPGWHRLTLRASLHAAPEEGDPLTFAFTCHDRTRTPPTFAYESSFPREEFAPTGRYAELNRSFFIGPESGSYNLTLRGSKGLRIEYLSLEPLHRVVAIESVHADKLLYGLNESGKVSVHILNAGGRPQTCRLTVAVESGLAESSLLFDRQVTVAGAVPGQADSVEIPLPPQGEYGHALIATVNQDSADASTARDYFYTSDRPAQVGHLGEMGIDAAYGAGNAPSFVQRLRRHCFPLYEIIFWAPDDVLELVPPPGKDRWWSGQTLARMSTESLKERIRVGHEQGMKVLAYTNLRYDFGYRIAEDFRRHPEFCEWDAREDQAFSVRNVRQQAREDDAERFDASAPEKPKFKASGVWRLAAGNPAMVDAHIDQLVRSTRQFGWDGWRYDDHYEYDAPAVDLLGRCLPAGGWRNPAIVARIRAALEKARPGTIYGHNLEWAQDEPEKADRPMPLDTPPHPNDYYTEFLRAGGVHVQERWLAHAIERHAPWEQMRDNLLALGHNAYRRGGYAYGLTFVNKARGSDARHLIALHLAALTHLAGDVRDANIGQMQLACRYCDLLYGDHIVPIPDGGKTLQVDAGGKSLWWQRYVRYREIAPGHRVYYVHLINPPRDARIAGGGPDLPEPLTNLGLSWTLPSGWKATRAYQLSADGAPVVETQVLADARTYLRKDFASPGLTCRELPLREDGGAMRLVVPSVQVASLVAVDCRGPENDVAPDIRFALPPVPATNVDLQWREAQGFSPYRQELTYDISNSHGWTRPDPVARGKRIPLRARADPGATNGVMAPCVEGWALESNRTSVVVEGGLYRLSIRVKCTAAPPPGARLSLSAWNPPKSATPWRVSESIPLDNLSPEKGWQSIHRDVELGYSGESFSLSVRGGFDGLLIDRIHIQAMRLLPEVERLRARKLVDWPAGLGLSTHSGTRIWLGEGLYTESYALERSLRAIPGVTIDRAEQWTYQDKRGFHGTNWNKPEELSAYDLVILANVDVKSLTLEQRVWLRAYVEAGGSLLLIGGPYGLGRGGWQESDSIERLLPVKLHDYDLRPFGAGTPLALRIGEGGILTGPGAEAPAAIWLHEVEPKAGATVALTAGNRPCLVTGPAGKGRVAVLALTPLGEVPDSARPWWRWPGWEQLLTQTAEWLLKKR